MTEYKTLKELWRQAGEKPFDACLADDNVFHKDNIFHVVTLSPDGRDAVGWSAGTYNGCIIHSADSGRYRLAPPKNRLVPHWPAIRKFKGGEGAFFLTDDIYSSTELAAEAWKDAGYPFVRLATELTPIMLEIE